MTPREGPAAPGAPARRALCWVLALGLALSGAAPALARVCGMEYLRQHHVELPLPLAKPAAVRQDTAPIAVGTRLEFVVSPDLSLRPATCHYVGDHCYVFVDDTQWDTNGGFIYQADVDSLGVLFDRHTPSDPQRGIYEQMVALFGAPADVDGDPRIYVVVAHVADPLLVGLFDPRVAAWSDASRRRDTLYLSSTWVHRRPYVARGTMAHEFQHLIHWNYDPREITFFNEGLSEYAEYLCGFQLRSPAGYFSNANVLLTGWNSTLDDYSRAALWTRYLADQFGLPFIRRFVQNANNGIPGFEQSLSQSGITKTFTATAANFFIANWLGSNGPDPTYRYKLTLGVRPTL